MGLELTKMRQDLKKSVSNLIEGEENVLSFGYDFSLKKLLLKFYEVMSERGDFN